MQAIPDMMLEEPGRAAIKVCRSTFRMASLGRYAKRSIATPMHRTQLWVGPQHPAPPSAGSAGLLGLTALCIVTGSAGTSSGRRWRGSA